MIKNLFNNKKRGVKKDRKIITKHLGELKEKISPKMKIYFFLALAGLILILSLVFLIDLGPTGKAILNIEPDYKQGEFLEGTLKFSLTEGELIPASTSVITVSYTHLTLPTTPYV